MLIGFFPVQSSAEDGKQLGHQLATPAGNVHHGPPSSYEPSSSLLVKADAHVPNVPYIVVVHMVHGHPVEHRITCFPFITQGHFHGSWSRSPRKLSESTPGATTTLAGSGSAGFLDGASGSAKFYLPFGVDIDPTSTFALVAVRAVSPEPASGGCFLPSATPPLPQPHCIPLCLRGQ